MSAVSWDWVDYLPAILTLAALLLLVVLLLEWRISRAIKRHDARLVQAIKDDRRGVIAAFWPDELRNEVEALTARPAHQSCQYCGGDLAEWECELLRTQPDPARPYINGSPEVGSGT